MLDLSAFSGMVFVRANFLVQFLAQVVRQCDEICLLNDGFLYSWTFWIVFMLDY